MEYLSIPTRCKELRGADATGNGWWGAKRGSRKHEGCDYVCQEGDEIFACANGVIRNGQVYSTSSEMTLIEIKNSIYKVKQMYVDSIVENGETVEKGQLIGYSQSVSAFHNNPDMKNHCHITVWKNGLKTDPEPILI